MRADHLQRAGEHDLVDALLGGTLEHVLVHRDVLVEDELGRGTPDARVVAQVDHHVDVLEQFERGLVIEEVGKDEAVRHISGVDDVGGEQIEARIVEPRGDGAAEPSGRPGDQHSRLLRRDGGVIARPARR